MTQKNPREFVQGGLDLLVLSALADGPKYGYLIQKRIREATDHGVPLQAGTLYPLLHRMEAEKLIRARWDDSTSRQRKWYELTAAGRRHLTRQAQDWVRLTDLIRDLLTPVLEPKPGV
ncbi:MAG: helix-turn-helix transcriptional regulator [Pirellulales bacterium]|nr:helix-turn-helix transcriptional regulator [Pirellulales bacterium]